MESQNNILGFGPLLLWQELLINLLHSNNNSAQFNNNNLNNHYLWLR